VKDIGQYLDAGIKVIVLFAAIGTLYLQKNYVTREEFVALSDKMSERISKIEQVLIRMEATAETDHRQDIILADHENRLRAIEKN
jgi:hypothetical protein